MYQTLSIPEARLILPGDEEFDLTIGSILPFDWEEVAYKNFGNFCFICDSQSGIMRAASHKETEEYLMGGEYQERMNLIGDEELEEEAW